MSEKEYQQNPYTNRNHEDSSLGRDDIRAVAGLLGNVTGSLRELDNKIVGSDSQFTKALKIDPKETLKKIIGQTPGSPPSNNNTSDNVPSVDSPHPVGAPPVQATTNSTELSSRLARLEHRVFGDKKFKRGVTYDVTSLNVKGNYKSQNDILDIVSSELNKQVKVITIRLNDTNKNKK